MLRNTVETALKRCSCGSLPEESGEDEEDFNERKINEDLERLNKDLLNAKKLLLLGAGEAGKSTFFKQMHINYGGGFSVEARLEYKRVIHQNILTAMQSMLNAMNALRIPYDKIENVIMANDILSTNAEAVINLEQTTVSAIKCLWADRGVQKCYERRREYQIIDSAKYFLDQLDCVTQPDYVPDDDQILHSRVITKGVVEHVFDIHQKSRTLLRVIDVGGQRSERPKWFKYFDDVTAVIFLTSLCEYDQTLSEAQELNRMEESKSLFRVILSSDYFTNSSIILFLNKQDILEEKIMTSHLVDYYPEYQGAKQNADEAKSFIRKMFLELVDKERNVYTHYTCATDTENFRIVFLAVRETIIFNYLNKIGIN